MGKARGLIWILFCNVVVGITIAMISSGMIKDMLIIGLGVADIMYLFPLLFGGKGNK
jgi:hypothetical protein